MWQLPYDKMERLVEKATGTVTVGEVGCCLLGGQTQKGCESFDVAANCSL
jgi:hypothetical protein